MLVKSKSKAEKENWLFKLIFEETYEVSFIKHLCILRQTSS